MVADGAASCFAAHQHTSQTRLWCETSLTLLNPTSFLPRAHILLSFLQLFSFHLTTAVCFRLSGSVCDLQRRQQIVVVKTKVPHLPAPSWGRERVPRALQSIAAGLPAVSRPGGCLSGALAPRAGGVSTPILTTAGSRLEQRRGKNLQYILEGMVTEQ